MQLHRLAHLVIATVNVVKLEMPITNVLIAQKEPIFMKDLVGHVEPDIGQILKPELVIHVMTLVLNVLEQQIMIVPNVINPMDSISKTTDNV